MAFINTFGALKPTEPFGDNTTNITQLPANIIEAFIPGYSIISDFLWETLGFDITFAVSTCLLLFGLTSVGKFFWNHAYHYFEVYFMSSISIDSDDDIYGHVMDWLGSQKVLKISRNLMAKTGHKNAWDVQERDTQEIETGPNKFLNFSNWDAKVPPKYEPSFGSHRFFHRGRIFEFQRDIKQTMNSGRRAGIFREEIIKLTCIGRSTQPIKDLIKECRDHHLDKERSCTVVRRPAPKDLRARGYNNWHRVATRPSRPIETVVLDNDEKNRVLRDINEYLHPGTPRWYANRGIPYRRGYLFAGPPGTGKSSLAWAIAGFFGLDIYCISLVERTLTEEDLGLLFTDLPRRCVVLLEDIDSAGIIKRQDPEVEEQSKDSENPKQNNRGITLSGLLNAIDGVATHEGRVLVLTTNFPEKLDSALIRPGRVDIKVNFTMATRSQICELFTRMYSHDDHPCALATSQLKETAEKFAAGLDENFFTPAEVQGFLLTRKTDPMKALEEVEAWKNQVVNAKQEKSKKEAMLP